MSREIISRSEAKLAGLNLYFTGVACKQGHLAERYVSGTRCKECCRLKNARVSDAKREQINAAKRARRANNPEKYKEEHRRSRLKNRDQINAKQRAAYSANIAEARERQRGYYQANLEKKRAYAREAQNARYRRDPTPMKANARRRSMKERRASPKWSCELDEFVWQEAYALSLLRKSATGIKWHADHMIPIAAEAASGLHVWNNCQVIPAILNRAKSNKLIFTRHGEWVGAL